MKLRGKVALTLGVLIVPFTVALVALYARLERVAIEEAAVDAVRARIEGAGEAWCERLLVRGQGRRGGPMRGMRRASPIFPYDAAHAGLVPDAPPMPEPLREALDEGAEVASMRTELRGIPMLAIAVRLSDIESPCETVLVHRPIPPRVVGPALALPLLVSIVAIGIAMLAAGPIVGRIRRLTDAVRQSRDGDAPLPTEGNDEIAELATALDAHRQRERAQMDALRARDQALTDYVANTTHDLMLPLTVLQGHLVTMRDAADPATATVVRSALEESHHIASIVQNLSAAAKLDAGAPHLHFADVDLSALIERVAARHRPIAREKAVSLEHAVPETPLRIEADPTLLEQAVSNLVHNAVRYTEGGGHVAVVLDRRGEEGFRIRVIDDGPGLSDEELERVTERRFRGGAARSRHPHGLGLGLHIVRDVAERHGFSLSFERPQEGGLVVELAGTRGKRAA